MASISLKVRPGRPNAAGRFPIFVSIIHNKEARFIPTPYDVASPSHFSGGRILIRGASEANKHLANILDEYRGKLARLDLSSISTASQLKEALSNIRTANVPPTISKMFSQRAAQMEKEGRNSYADMLRYSTRVIVPIIGDLGINSLTRQDVRKLLDGMRAQGYASGNIQMRLTHFKSCINRLLDDGIVRYEAHPFQGVKIPQSAAKYNDITLEEFIKIRELKPENKRLEIARNLFLLSFYLCGLNLADLTKLGKELQAPILKFERQKTRGNKRGNGLTSFTIPNEAKELIRWAEEYGIFQINTLASYKNLQRYVNRCFSLLADRIGITNSFSYYSARKTFCQFAFEIGTPLEIVEYCIGHTMKTNRPVFNYVRIMQRHADTAIRNIINYTNESGPA